LLTALAIVAKADSPQDLQNNFKLAETICVELKAGHFDLLESQYRDFANRGHQIQPDTLVLENALPGECDCLHTLAEAQHLDMKDPELNQQVQARVEEITSRMKAVPADELRELMSEPQYHAVEIHLYILEGVDNDRVQAHMHDAQDRDPCHVPFCTWAISFLSTLY
jgi:hypothetical protein